MVKLIDYKDCQINQYNKNEHRIHMLKIAVFNTSIESYNKDP